MVLTYSKKTDLGNPAPDFSLPGTDGKNYTLADFRDKDVLVIIFTCNHCPYAQAAKPKIHNLYNRYKDKNVQFLAINPNESENHPEDSFEKMKEEKNNYPFPYLRDESQEIARAFKAVCTPDIFVYDNDRKLTYHGQIDDDRPSLGAVAAKVMLGKEIKQKDSSSRDLEKAIQALLEGKQPDQDQKPSLGCSIKWKE